MLAWKNIFLFQVAVWLPDALKVTLKDPAAPVLTGLAVYETQFFRSNEYCMFNEMFGTHVKFTVMLVVSEPTL